MMESITTPMPVVNSRKRILCDNQRIVLSLRFLADERLEGKKPREKPGFAAPGGED
jgi:hypothetical protein